MAPVRTQSMLPEGYGELFHIDLQKDKRLALIVNGIALVILAVLAVAGHLIVPISALFDMDGGLGPYVLRFAVLVLGTVVYILLHEAVHGVVMYHCSHVKPRFGFTGLYAFAGSDVYFNKRDYIVIALAPVVVWGVVLAILTPLVPRTWFWVVWFIQIANLSGGGGDLYVTWRFAKLPGDILVQDTGVAMTVFGRRV